MIHNITFLILKSNITKLKSPQMQNRNVVQTNCSDNISKIKLIKQLCATIGEAFSRIEDICSEQMDEVTESSPFGQCEGVGLYLYIKQNEQTLKMKYSAFTDNQILAILLTKWHKLPQIEKKEYCCKLDLSKTNQLKRLRKMEKMDQKLTDSFQVSKQLNDFNDDDRCFDIGRNGSKKRIKQINKQNNIDEISSKLSNDNEFKIEVSHLSSKQVCALVQPSSEVVGEQLIPKVNGLSKLQFVQLGTEKRTESDNLINKIKQSSQLNKDNDEIMCMNSLVKSNAPNCEQTNEQIAQNLTEHQKNELNQKQVSFGKSVKLQPNKSEQFLQMSKDESEVSSNFYDLLFPQKQEIQQNKPAFQQNQDNIEH